jgi:hypothetical protein
MSSTPILVLDENVNINSIFLDSINNSILIGTSDGRIIKMGQFVTNAYLTGERSIFAQIQDGFGNVSDVGYSNLTYQLKEQIAKVLEDKTLESLKQIVIPFSTSMLENKVEAIFTSQVLNGGEDFIGWTSMEWGQIVPTDTSTRIYVRSANSPNDVVASKWYCLEYTDNAGSVFLSLDDLDNAGRYIQFKIVLTTNAANITPSVYNLNVFYKTISASFFFTQKYILKKETNIKSIILTANVIKPQYTEVKFGISDGKTTSWEDYSPVDIEKLTDIPNTVKDRMKIGVKLISHTEYSYPIVNEFSLMFKGSKENLLNK